MGTPKRQTKMLGSTPKVTGSPEQVMRILHNQLHKQGEFRITARGIPLIEINGLRISWFAKQQVYRVFRGNRESSTDNMREFRFTIDIISYVHSVKAERKTRELACPYCGGKAHLKGSGVVYGEGRDYGKLFVCDNYPQCDAYVGTHKGTEEPLGTLANAKLRGLRKRVHSLIDPLWRDNPDRCVRVVVYKVISTMLGVDEYHTASCDEAMCEMIINRFDEIALLVANDRSHPRYALASNQSVGSTASH